MPQLSYYLNFQGNTEEAFLFYKSVFGGEFAIFMRFSDMPDGPPVADADKNKIMHVSYPIGSSMLMGTDALESMGHHLTMGNNFSISVNTSSKEEADKTFSSLAAGGVVTMPIADTFWGAYFGSLTDKFGVNWMVNFDYPRS